MTKGCVKLVKKHRGEIVTEALREEIIRGLVSMVKEQKFMVVEDGTVTVEYKYYIDEKAVRVAYGVVDKVIELLERGGFNG